jgi:hypothetical protein
MITLFCLAFSNFIRLRLKRKNDDALLKAIPAYVPAKRLPKRKNPVPDSIPTFYY